VEEEVHWLPKGPPDLCQDKSIRLHLYFTVYAVGNFSEGTVEKKTDCARLKLPTFDNASYFTDCSCCCHSCLPLTRGCFSAVQIWSHWWGQAKCTGTAKTVPEWREQQDIPNCSCQLWSGIQVHLESIFSQKF